MKKICFIIPYFGKLPDYFHMFLKSCENNPSVDFLIFTDDNRPFNYPANVKLNITTLNDVKSKIQHCIDFPITLDTPYKLCDYKVVYGEAFRDELKGYDFWGHCDIDLLWGNIRTFLTDDVLDQYDRILTRGHCSLYRNNAICNSWYRNLDNKGCQDYKMVFQSEKNYAFDEWANHLGGGISEILKRNGIAQYDKLIYADINAYKNHFQLTRVLDKQYCLSMQCFKDRLVVHSITNNRIESQEYMYCHFQKRNPKAGEYERRLEEFAFVEPYRFIKTFSVENMMISEYKKKVYFRGFNKQLFLLRWKQVKNKLGLK